MGKVVWTPDNDRKLLIRLIDKSAKSYNSEALCQLFEGATPKAIEERIAKLKREAKALDSRCIVPPSSPHKPKGNFYTAPPVPGQASAYRKKEMQMRAANGNGLDEKDSKIQNGISGDKSKKSRMGKKRPLDEDGEEDEPSLFSGSPVVAAARASGRMGGSGFGPRIAPVVGHAPPGMGYCGNGSAPELGTSFPVYSPGPPPPPSASIVSGSPVGFIGPPPPFGFMGPPPPPPPCFGVMGPPPPPYSPTPAVIQSVGENGRPTGTSAEQLVSHASS